MLKQYLTYFSQANYQQAYALLSKQDTEFMSQAEYEEKVGRMALLWSKANVDIKPNPTISGDIAIVKVDITTPDIRPLMGQLMQTAFSSSFKKDVKDTSGKDMEELIAEEVKKGNLPTMTQEKSYELVKESGKWKVLLGIAKQDKLKSLLSEAKELRKQKKLHVAQTKYEEALELDSELVAAKTGLEATKGEIASFEEKQAYIKNVELYDLKSKYYSTYSGKVAGVEFKLKNKGNRTLKEIEVTVYFEDTDGNTIFEENYHPVLDSSYSFSDNNKPLKPNYIWQMEKDKFYQAKSVPDEWKEGAVKAKITDIEVLAE
ncbi:MAG: hypothetical protein CMM94_06215 [Rickettsiales bacterium]|nr:hypothetical protein [Rickettsiales bacterium]